ncbi:FBF1-like protein, partial [Mya arenaria]
FQTKQQEAPKPTGQVGAQKTGVGRPEPTAGKADDRKSAPMGKADYLGLGEEVDPSKLMRTRSDAPKFGVGSDPTDVLKEDDIFVSPRTSEKPDQADSEDEDYESGCKPLFESASRQRQMSPRLKKDNQRHTSPRSPERKALDTSPRTRSLADQINHAVEPQPAKQGTHDFGTHQPAAPQAQLQSAQTQSQPATGGEDELNSSTDFFSFKKKEPVMSTGETQSGNQNGLQLSTGFPSELQTGLQSGLQSTYLPPPSTASSQPDYLAGNLQPQGFQAGSLQLQTGSQVYPDLMTGSMMTNAQQTQQQQQQMMRQQQLKQQQMMKQIQRQQQQFQKQQQQQLQQIQQQFMQPIAADTSLFGVGNSLFQDDMSFGLGGQLDIDAQSKKQTKDTGRNKQQARRKVTRVRQMEEEKAELTASMYKRLEDAEKDKAVEIERLKEVQRQALENIKRDHDETLVRLRRSKDQQIDAAAASHDTSRSLIAAVELIQNNAKDLGELQRKADNWHAQGLDDREITLRAKDEQLKMLQDRLNKQQDDTEQERQRLQELVARLETQIREQTRMLEEERWKVKQEQSRLQGLQNAMEDERRSWNDHQARERMNMEKSREALLEEQKTTLSQLHKERQALAEEQVQFNMKQKLAREEGAQYTSRVTQAKAEYEALSRAVAEAKDKYDNLKEENRREEDRIQDERRRLEKERAKMEKKEAELMESAHMIKEKSQDIEEAYAEGTKKYEEGIMALAEAQRLENEEGKRIDTINQQLNILKMKEKEITEDQKYLEEQNLYLHALKFMPYSSPKS